MRIAGLIVLAIFFPAFAHATSLVNINTADATLLDTLPGVGPVIAGRIISYRETNGPFGTIEDLQKVSGIGSGSTYAKIAPLITVSDANASDTSNTTSAVTTDSSTQTPASQSSTESATTDTSPPSAFTVDAGINRGAVMEVPLHLFARALTKNGVDPHAHIVWGFGDGSSAEGSTVEKTYRYAGTYLVVVIAIDEQATARDEFIVTVRPAHVRILEIPDTGIAVTNETNERLDLSGWALFADRGSFRIPDGTVMLPNAQVLFSSAITKLPTAPEVTLAYPNGGIAARYTVSPEPIKATASVAAPDEQPPPRVNGYEQVQAVEPTIISPKTNIQAHEEAVGAPAAANELAAAGAALLANETAPAATARAAGIFKSPWTLGFLGVVILAGSAFILL